MKKAIVFVIIVLMILSGCAGGASKGGFKDSFVPIEELSLPVGGSEIIDTAQIDDKLYILADGKVFCTKLTTGESETVCSTDCTLMCAYDGMLHLFNPSMGSFSVIAPDGAETDSFAVAELSGMSGETAKSFGVCGEYYVILKTGQAQKSPSRCDRQKNQGGILIFLCRWAGIFLLLQ